MKPVLLPLAVVAAALAACASEHDVRPKSALEQACADEAETQRGFCRRYNRLNQELCLDQGRRPGERVVLSDPGEPGGTALSRYTDYIVCRASPLDCQVAHDEAYLSCRVRRAKPAPPGLFLE